MSGIKSALTAALSGKGSSKPPSDKKTSSTDAFSFPCLGAASGANKEAELASQFDKLNVRSQSIAGSAPTAVLLRNGSVAVSKVPATICCCVDNHSLLVPVPVSQPTTGAVYGPWSSMQPVPRFALATSHYIANTAV